MATFRDLSPITNRQKPSKTQPPTIPERAGAAIFFGNNLSKKQRRRSPNLAARGAFESYSYSCSYYYSDFSGLRAE
jgi:hypothetical protein